MINSVTAAMYDAVLNFREAYVEYIPNYPIAAYRIDDEMANNPQFKAFVEVSGLFLLFLYSGACCSIGMVSHSSFPPSLMIG